MIRKSAKAIIRWLKRERIDDFDVGENLMDDTWHMEDMKLEELLAERKKLKEQKKRASHLDHEIQALRTQQLARGMSNA